MINNNLKYKNKYKRAKNKIYHHYFQIEKGLSYDEICEMIDNLIKGYNYNYETGILRADFIIRKTTNKISNKMLSFSIFIARHLTKEEQSKIMIDSSFQYNIDTGVFTIIHKVTYCKGDK